MLTIRLPELCPREIDYVLGVVFTEWLGVPYRLEVDAYDTIKIEREDRVLSLDASFFGAAASAWLTDGSMPKLPLWELKLDRVPVEIARRLRERIPETPSSLPVLYGKPRIDIPDENGQRVACGVDIFGSVFFMLSRYEEAVIPDRDEHDRFPATASVAHKAGFLERPIVNEYVELLWAMMSYLWPGLERKPRSFRMLVSHDVDSPFLYAGLPGRRMVLRRMAGDVVKRKSPPQAFTTWKTWNAVRRGDVAKDPHNTFDFIMSESEKRGLVSSFYFIPDHSAGAIDGRYTLDDPEIIDLMRVISSRGHEIGLHTSYNTYNDEQQTVREADILRRAMARIGAEQDTIGGRQHYLRWATPQTFRNWESAGMRYDSTLSYADHAGFRCGTCWEYPVYDVVDRRYLTLRERSLVAMEVSVANEKYMNLGYGNGALEVFAGLKESCRAYRGDFALLWHNTQLLDSKVRDFYLTVLDS